MIYLIRKTVICQRDAVCSESRSIDDLRSCFCIGSLKLDDRIRMFQNPFFGTYTFWHTGFHEIRAGRTVQNYRSMFKKFLKILFLHRFSSIIQKKHCE